MMMPDDLPGRWEIMIFAVGGCHKRLSDRLRKKIERLDRRVLMLDSRKWSV